MKLLITGATGFVGGEVLSQSIRNPAISSVVVLTRRPLPKIVANEPKVKEIVMQDFNVYSEEVKKELEGADACVWALGARLAVPEVEIDYPLALARAVISTRSATANKPFRYIYCSGMFAERDQTKTLWMTPGPRRIKGQAESSILSFAQTEGKSVWETYIARPGMIVRPQGDTLKKIVSAPIGTVDVDQLAAALVHIVSHGGDRDTYENNDILAVGNAAIKSSRS